MDSHNIVVFLFNALSHESEISFSERMVLTEIILKEMGKSVKGSILAFADVETENRILDTYMPVVEMAETFLNKLSSILYSSNTSKDDHLYLPKEQISCLFIETLARDNSRAMKYKFAMIDLLEAFLLEWFKEEEYIPKINKYAETWRTCFL